MAWSECDLVFQLPPDRAPRRCRRHAEHIADLVFYLSIGGEVDGSQCGRPDEVLLLRELPCVAEIVDEPVVLDRWIDEWIQQEPRLPGDLEPGRMGRIVPDITREEHVQCVETVDAQDVVEFLLHDWAEGD